MGCPKLNSAGETWLYALGRTIYRIYTSDEAPLIAYQAATAAVVLDGVRVRERVKCRPDLFKLAAERLLGGWLICAPPTISLADLLGRR